MCSKANGPSDEGIRMKLLKSADAYGYSNNIINHPLYLDKIKLELQETEKNDVANSNDDEMQRGVTSTA